VTALEHRVRALNEPGSPNLVHDDEFARRLGFRSGLVPGVAVYGYMAELPARLWADRWLANGTMSARFLKPVYDGEQVTVRSSPAGDGVDLELRNPEGELCASGHAEPAAEGSPPLLEHYPAAPLPVPARPPAFVEGQPLGSLSTSVRLSDNAWPARLANEVLVANVQLPPWIHAVLIRGGSGPGAEGGPGTEIGTGIRGSPDVWRAAGRHCRRQAIGRHSD